MLMKTSGAREFLFCLFCDRHINVYNHPINFRAILSASFGHVVANQRASIRQYTPPVRVDIYPTLISATYQIQS